MTATHNTKDCARSSLKRRPTPPRFPAERDRLFKNSSTLSERQPGGGESVLGTRDIDDARQNFLAQDALVKGSVAEQAQIQSQLDSMVNGEQSQIVSFKSATY